MVYFSVTECLCMYVLVIFIFILDSRLASFWKKTKNNKNKKTSFWLSACSVLIVVQLRLVRPSFPLVS